MVTLNDTFWRTWLNETLAFPSSRGFLFAEEMASLLETSPYTLHIVCQAIGFHGDDNTAWLEFQQSDVSSQRCTTYLRCNVSHRAISSLLWTSNRVAGYLLSTFLTSLPPEWETTSHFGPEIMFGGESATISIKRDHDIHQFQVNFCCAMGYDAHLVARVKHVLSQLIRYGQVRLRLMCLNSWLLDFVRHKGVS
jgi:hypothetical protein